MRRQMKRKGKAGKLEPGRLDVEMADETTFTTTATTASGEEEPEVRDGSGRGAKRKKRELLLPSSMNAEEEGGAVENQEELLAPPSSRKGKAKRNWRNVTPAPDSSFLLGSEEGGFLSLEEIDGEDWNVIGSGSGSGSGSEPPVVFEEEEEDPSSVAAAGVPHDGGKKKKKSSSSSSKRKRVQNGDGDSENVEISLEEVDGGDSELLNDQNLRKKKKKKKKQKKKKKRGKSAEEGHKIPRVPTKDIGGATDVEEEEEEKPTSQRKKKPKLGSRARKLLKGQRDGGGGDRQDAALQVGGSDGNADGDGDGDGVAESSAVKEDEMEVEEEEKVVLMDMAGWAEMRLHSKLERAIAELGFKKPTPIQRQCIPAAAHKGKDVMGAAETGSGKTLAFGLPILQRLLQEEDKAALNQQQQQQQQNLQDEEEEEEEEQEKQPPVRNLGPMRALVITPTRELALQICEHLKAAAKWTNFRVVPIVGGMAQQKQQRLLKQMPEIVVGTPGRLWELISMGESHLLEMSYLSFFVLDEADRMVEKGHFKELQSIIDMLPTNRRPGKENQIPEVNGGADSGAGAGAGAGGTSEPTMPKKKRQTLVFSATLALPADFKSKLKKGLHQQQKLKNSKSVDSVAALSERAGVNHDAAIVDLTSSSIVAKELSESVIECRDEDKDRFLYYILKIHGGGRTIVFCTSIAALRRASAILKLLQVPAWPLHAQMQQKARLKAMDRFRGTEDCVLVATDVAARGLDVPGVRTVVHYQLPHSAEIYVHRSGRTARASTAGISIALVSPSDRAKYSTLCQALSRPQGLQPFPVNMSYFPAIERRVSLAVQVDKLMRKQSQSKATESWLERTAEAMDIDLEASEDEEDGRARPSTGAGAGASPSFSRQQQQQLRGLQRELQELLSQPMKPKAFSNRYITGAGMTPLLAKQLQGYALAKANPQEAAAAAALRKKGGKVLVIGQEQIEPLEALRLSATDPTPRLTRKRQ